MLSTSGRLRKFNYNIMVKCATRETKSLTCQKCVYSYLCCDVLSQEGVYSWRAEANGSRVRGRWHVCYGSRLSIIIILLIKQ